MAIKYFPELPACCGKLMAWLLLLTISQYKYAAGQVTGFDAGKLDLADRGYKIENHIRFNIPPSRYSVIRDTSGNKMTIGSPLVIINGDSIRSDEIRTRGQSSLLFRRKSFSFKLQSKATFTHGGREESLRKFFTLNLAMDRYYSNNRLAFEMMEKAGLFNLFYSFCEININGKSEGIYMVVERPEDWAVRKKKSPILIRRGYGHVIDKAEINRSFPRKTIRTFKSNYRAIYSSLNKYEGENLYNALTAILDLDSYMKWMAFNFLVRNRDYSDEVHFYADTTDNRFRIIPWDYDDLFATAPHEGLAESREVLGNRLVFSAEDLLDRKIASDKFLYNKYLLQFRDLLNRLTPGFIRKVLENTWAELYPYFSDPEIIAMSRYDIYKNASLENLRQELEVLYENLKTSRRAYLDLIEGQINSVK